MIIRQLKPRQYDHLHKDLLKKAHAKPLEASYTVNMTVNNVEYAVRIQPETRCRMAVLQALRIDRSEGKPDFELITRGNILLSLLEMLVYQAVR
ncbi:hypothetical protein DFR58_1654 [Anaerobacterium chartisolvens]|uniref:Uncharacterized protein n=1 Tax=Anaerobacterium chartisolvens TaxID=1297424 RepID=A0A369AC19_9FIRM|nr:hypothetical protein [Anaerobacterium chartisolvens]RCX06902.1 hypothetical protein DFR58_1654 [Anaerobacterium chartisolvens]